MPGSFDNPPASPPYESERSAYFAPPRPYPQDADYKDYPPNERPGYYPPPDRYDNGLAYGDPHPPPPNRQGSYGTYPPPRQNSYDAYPPRQNSYDNYPPQLQQAPRPSQAGRQPSYPYPSSDSRSSSYGYQYAQPPENITYKTDVQRRQYSQSEAPYYHDQPGSRKQSQSAYDPRTNAVEVTPYDRSSVVSTQSRMEIERRTSGGLHSVAPSDALAPRMAHLSVGGLGVHQPAVGGELPPPSPLLEAYRGTYQQMSPLPLAHRPHDDEDDLSDLEPLSPARTHASSKSVRITEETVIREKEKKRVTVYDPEEDAKKIGKALRHHGHPNGEVICQILPTLSHDQIVYLRKEYKKQIRVQGKGVNLSKHINSELKHNFGKAAYVTALGRWESEGYWANFFYQSHGSRRELLIEALMGRSNADIWNIKDEFKDKRYSDDLVKCMEKELKMDKFRTAVLLVLEERRQEEQDVYPVEYRMKDIETLHKALTAPKGGESTMLEIIVLRSDAHLREVLKSYERVYNENFPRAALKKSNNLVGEVIAHILNGVINKPARDALLLRHAIEDVAEKNKDEELRYELLISRLVRLHWDKVHLLRVKREYESKRGQSIEEDIQKASKGDLADFLCALCQTK
ncbi:hypothetical protein BDY17DRAFT_320887 [Neohortaea acidophila]|uniref:Annexin n=1 Tax=Neohortaea acidophila TaxID=245834 RepID=A0A6A6Q0X4_9PEZI|nr:uncharacterized protein BDY17DRAFT_320887 [Neohortaea acidophila]KAF2486060.1 hypothetical protein BDY17DRAFT_320887 [Neohortaea acidophila]